MIDPRPLKIKALECAVKDILTAKDRDQANERYKHWDVFHQEPEFIEAVKTKKETLK
jgi:hypothetical protein